MNNKGFAIGEILVGLVVLVGALWVAKPSWFPGASKRAAASTQATRAVEVAYNKQGAVVAASLSKINEVAATLDNTPTKTFFIQESQLALSRSPAPDVQELLEAERRKNATLTGQLQETRRLYDAASSNTAELKGRLDKAIQERREIDTELEKAAAAEHARTLQLMGIGLVALLLLGAWIYTRFMNITPQTLGNIRADIAAGVSPVTAIDTNISPRFFKKIQMAARQATPVK